MPSVQSTWLLQLQLLLPTLQAVGGLFLLLRSALVVLAAAFRSPVAVFDQKMWLTSPVQWLGESVVDLSGHINFNGGQLSVTTTLSQSLPRPHPLKFLPPRLHLRPLPTLAPSERPDPLERHTLQVSNSDPGQVGLVARHCGHPSLAHPGACARQDSGLEKTMGGEAVPGVAYIHAGGY